jgi:hypothetical protein
MDTELEPRRVEAADGDAADADGATVLDRDGHRDVRVEVDCIHELADAGSEREDPPCEARPTVNTQVPGNFSSSTVPRPSDEKASGPRGRFSDRDDDEGATSSPRTAAVPAATARVITESTRRRRRERGNAASAAATTRSVIAGSGGGRSRGTGIGLASFLS